MKLRILMLVLFVFLLGLSAVACNPFASDSKRWSMNVTGYDTVRQIDTGSAITGVREKQDGAKWLRLYVSLTNHADEPYEIDWQVDAFVLADNNGTTRPEELELANLPGYLDTEFGPGETNEGFVVFLLDSETGVTAGTLTWKPAKGNLVKAELDDVPAKRAEGS